MYSLKGKVFSHNSIKTDKRETLLKVASSKPLHVNTYDELMKNIAIIANKNKNLFPLFRGQNKEYMSKENGRECSSIIPSYNRPPKKNGKRSIYMDRNYAMKKGAEQFLTFYSKKMKELKKT